MSAFLKQPWSNTKARFVQYEKKILEKLWETLEKLFPMIQLRWSIYNHFLKPLH